MCFRFSILILSAYGKLNTLVLNVSCAIMLLYASADTLTANNTAMHTKTYWPRPTSWPLVADTLRTAHARYAVQNANSNN